MAWQPAGLRLSAADEPLVASILSRNAAANNPITFGIELEMLVPYLRIGESEFLLTENADRSEEHFLVDDLTDKLRQNGFPVDNNEMKTVFNEWAVATDSSIEADMELMTVRSSGTFPFPAGKSTSCLRSLPELSESDRMLVEFGQIEIKTPKLLLSESGFATLERFLTFLDKEIPAAVNHTCGLHVHVGHQFKNRPGYRLGDLKNLLLITVLGEYQLSQLHPDVRVFKNYACKLNSVVFPPRFRNNANFIVQKIEGCYSKAALARLATHAWGDHHTERRFGVNFNSLDPTEYNLRTVEFRVHEGSVNTTQIQLWARFCASLVLRCTESDMLDGPRFLLGIDQSTSVWEILGQLGLEEFVDQFPLYNHTWQRYTNVRDGQSTTSWRNSARMTVNRLSDPPDSSDDDDEGPVYAPSTRQIGPYALENLSPYDSDVSPGLEAADEEDETEDYMW